MRLTIMLFVSIIAIAGILIGCGNSDVNPGPATDTAPAANTAGQATDTLDETFAGFDETEASEADTLGSLESDLQIQ